MTDNNLHFLIYKQLKRANLSDSDISLNKRSEWHDFLSRISRTYLDQEQERYLIDRSFEISSREMRDLNEKLELAQKIAHLGYWFYDCEENKLMWSNETFHLTGFDPADGIPDLKDIKERIHEEDRDKVELLMRRAFEEGKDYEVELRFKNKKDETYHWQYAKGHPHVNTSLPEGTIKPIRYLSGISMDITDRKKAEEDLKNLHQKLLSISRQAGMAEVATSVLHNVGNIINSANVSISLLIEMLSQSRIERLIRISKIIKEHIINKDDYLTNDQSGKDIPDYLIALSENIAKEHDSIVAEINNIDNHMNHIKDVVALQKDISGIAGLKENIFINEIVDLAIQMGCTSTSNEIQIIKDYQCNTTIMVEKSKLLQILVNMMRNAKESVLSADVIPKKILISIKEIPEKSIIEMMVKDNGLGISSENLTSIFSFGFTTKPNGHGFGLHSSAIAAKELGGTIKVISDGIGKGATFIVELPLSNNMNDAALLSEMQIS